MMIDMCLLNSGLLLRTFLTRHLVLRTVWLALVHSSRFNPNTPPGSVKLKSFFLLVTMRTMACTHCIILFSKAFSWRDLVKFGPPLSFHFLVVALRSVLTRHKT
jgi:hypothetical protein